MIICFLVSAYAEREREKKKQTDREIDRLVGR